MSSIEPSQFGTPGSGPDELDYVSGSSPASGQEGVAEEHDKDAAAIEGAETRLVADEATLAGALQKANNLSDVASASTARTNLGLGSAATQASSAFDAAGAASTAQSNAEAASLAKANNLDDVASAATALANLGAAPLASPALTGTPTAPTAAAGTDTTQLATTAFATAAATAAQSAAESAAEAAYQPIGSYMVTVPGLVWDGATDNHPALSTFLATLAPGSVARIEQPASATGHLLTSQTVVPPEGVCVDMGMSSTDAYELRPVPGSNLDAVIASSEWWNNAPLTTYGTAFRNMRVASYDSGRTTFTVTSASAVAAYAPGTAYTAGQFCTYSGQLYQAAQATTGNAPTGAETSNADWTWLANATNAIAVVCSGAPAGGWQVATGVCFPAGMGNLNGSNIIVGVSGDTVVVNSYFGVLAPAYGGSGGTIGVGQGLGIATCSFHFELGRPNVGKCDGHGILAGLFSRNAPSGYAANGGNLAGSINEWRIGSPRIYMAGDATGQQYGGVGLFIPGGDITDGYCRDLICSGAGGAWAAYCGQGGDNECSGWNVYKYAYGGIAIRQASSVALERFYAEGSTGQSGTYGEIDEILVGVNGPACRTGDHTVVQSAVTQTGTYNGLHIVSEVGAVRASVVVGASSFPTNGGATAFGTAVNYDDSNEVGLKVVSDGKHAIDAPTTGGWTNPILFGPAGNFSAKIDGQQSPFARDTGVVACRPSSGAGTLMFPANSGIAAGAAMPASPVSHTSYALCIPVDLARATQLAGIDFYLGTAGVQGSGGNCSLAVGILADDGTGTAPAKYKACYQEVDGISPTQAAGLIANTFTNPAWYGPVRWWLALGFQLGSAGVAMTTMPAISLYTMPWSGQQTSLAPTGGSLCWLFPIPATGSMGQVNGGTGSGNPYAYCPALAARTNA